MAAFKEIVGLETKTDPNDVFDLEECLGEGSYGEVYTAFYKDRKQNGGKPLAMKIIPVESEEDKKELAKEIKILKQTKDPSIVNYFGAWVETKSNPQKIWIAMELCDAGSVNDLIHFCNYSLEENEIKAIVASALLGLCYLHKNDMIHRDIKAGNILLTDDGEAKLADFGVSAQMEANQQKRTTVIGTPYWMAPEVIQEDGGGYDARADVWSLGITMIEMAQMEPPYSNIHPMRAIFMIPNRPSPGLDKPEEWSEEMVDFLSKCLTKKADQRPWAQDLKDHPWVENEVKQLIKNKGQSDVIKKLVSTHIAKIKEVRAEEAQLRAQEGTGACSDTDTQSSRGNTCRLDNLGTAVPNTGGDTLRTGGGPEDSRTIVHRTVQARTQKGTTQKPLFMQYFMDGTKQMKRTKKLAPKASKDNDDWVIPAECSEMINLQTKLANLDSQYRTDIKNLRIAYEQRRNKLIQAATDV